LLEARHFFIAKQETCGVKLGVEGVLVHLARRLFDGLSGDQDSEWTLLCLRLVQLQVNRLHLSRDQETVQLVIFVFSLVDREEVGLHLHDLVRQLQVEEPLFVEEVNGDEAVMGDKEDVFDLEVGLVQLHVLLHSIMLVAAPEIFHGSFRMNSLGLNCTFAHHLVPADRDHINAVSRRAIIRLEEVKAIETAINVFILPFQRVHASVVVVDVYQTNFFIFFGHSKNDCRVVDRIGFCAHHHTVFHCFDMVLVSFISLDIVIVKIDELDLRHALPAFLVTFLKAKMKRLTTKLTKLNTYSSGVFEENFVELHESVGLLKNEAETLDSLDDFHLAVLHLGLLVTHVKETLRRIR